MQEAIGHPGGPAAGPTAPTVAVVICAYTAARWELTVRAVESVRSQRPAPAEVIVVIDHNADLLDRARRELAGVDVIANSDAKGLAGARNSGVAAASATIVAFLDDDASADEGWLARLVEGYADDAVVGVGGYVRAEWPPAGRPAWFPPEFDWVVGCSYRGLPTAAAPVRNFIGANMSFRRSSIDAVGGFSTGVGRSATAPLGCEETELSIRVTQRTPGAVLLYDPTAAVGHTVSADRLALRYFVRRCLAEGLSKAVIAGMIGAGDATSSERTYVTGTLLPAVGRGVAGAARRDLLEVKRLLVLVIGLTATVAGYVASRVGLGAMVLRAVERWAAPPAVSTVTP